MRQYYQVAVADDRLLADIVTDYTRYRPKVRTAPGGLYLVMTVDESDRGALVVAESTLVTRILLDLRLAEFYPCLALDSEPRVALRPIPSDAELVGGAHAEATQRRFRLN
jgi:hypothetical protein